MRLPERASTIKAGGPIERVVDELILRKIGVDGHILQPKHVVRSGMFGAREIRDTRHGRIDEYRVCRGGVADQSQSRTAFDDQRVSIWQEGQAVSMQQPARQDVDTNVMLLRCVEIVGPGSHADRRDTDFFGTTRERLRTYCLCSETGCRRARSRIDQVRLDIAPR